MHYFCFVDESGNKPQGVFFGIGVLLVPVSDMGHLFRVLRGHSDRIKTASRNAMLSRGIRSTGGVHFELKFSRINRENERLYSALIRDYFSFRNVRFCAFVMDRGTYPPPRHMSHFDMYLNSLAGILHDNFQLAGEDSRFVILADEITQKRGGDTYEDLLFRKIVEKGTPREKVFGVSRMESHANIFIQMTDILLGSVMHSFQYSVPSPRKERVIRTAEESIGCGIGREGAVTEPNYFSVREHRG